MTSPLCSISIMAHEGRAELVPALQEQLGGAPVAWDPKGFRPREESVWEVRRLALELRDPQAAFHLVVQDDAVVGDNFADRLAALLEDDQKAYCLYYRHKNHKHNGEMIAAAEAGRAKGGFTYRRMMWGVGMVLPSWLISDLIAYCDALTDVKQDDVRIRYFLRERGVKTFYPLPSLISHRKELMGRNGLNRGRVAKWFE
jgi:hypothetical protein